MTGSVEPPVSGVADQLRAAKALIDTPDKWTQFTVKAEVDGQLCFCALGALWMVVDKDERLSGPAYEALSASCPTGSAVSAFNDRPTTTHADVMDLFDRAIAKASTTREG